MRQRHVLTVAVVVLLAACSGGNDAAPATTSSSTAAPGTTAPPATTPPSANTTAPTTAPPPTTQPDTTPPPTPPPTTAPRDIVAEVTQAALAYDDWYVECLRHPADCDPSLVSPEGSDAFNALTRTRDELVGAEMYVGTEDRGYTIVESVDIRSDHVLATVCGYTTLVLYGPPGPDGQPTVQNDTPGTVREAWQFVEIDGRWMFTHGDTISQEARVNSCPPEG